MQDFRPFHVMVSMGPPGPPGSTARSAVERSGGEAPVRARSKGAFTNYVYKIWLFLTTYPPPFTFSMI